MTYFLNILALISAIGAGVGALSKWAAWREEKLRQRVVEDVKWWMASKDGRYWFQGYIRDLDEEGSDGKE